VSKNILSDNQSLGTSTRIFTDWEIGDWTYQGNRYYKSFEGTPFGIEGKANITQSIKTTSSYTIYGQLSAEIKGIA